MKASSACIDIIRQFEGFRAKPYLCPAGVPTIGYGSTRYPDGKAVTLGDQPVSEPQAAQIMLSTLEREYVPAVNRYVQVRLTQGQFDALVDFAYNCGAQNLRTSTLLRLLNAGDFKGAAGEFGKWVNAGGVPLDGLRKRRAAEWRLFTGAV